MLAALPKSYKTELYRKAIHLSSLWIPFFIFHADRNWSIFLFSALLTINLILEYAACNKTAFIGSLFRKIFIKTLRNREVSCNRFVPSGSVYILAAALITSVCYTPRAAAAAMSIVLISDSCAALFGKFFGAHRFYNGKSAEGSLAFLISAILVAGFLFPETSSLIIYSTAAVATGVEFFEKEIGIDDNLAIPVASGFILNLISL